MSNPNIGCILLVNMNRGKYIAKVFGEFFGQMQSRSGKRLKTIFTASTIIAATVYYIGPAAEHTYTWFYDTLRYTFIISGITALFSGCALGVMSVGQSAGKQDFLRQLAVTLRRVFLYLFLPCAIVTILLVLIVTLANQV